MLGREKEVEGRGPEIPSPALEGRGPEIATVRDFLGLTLRDFLGRKGWQASARSAGSEDDGLHRRRYLQTVDNLSCRILSLPYILSCKVGGACSSSRGTRELEHSC